MSHEDTNTGLFGRVGGFLSKREEWHALGIGAFFGLATGLTLRPEVAAFFVMVVIGAAKAPSPHFEDAIDEFAYAGGAFVALFLLAFVIRLVTIGL